MSLFPRYPSPASAIVEAAASVLAAASQVDGVGESVQQELKGAQSAVGGTLESPLATAVRQLSTTSAEVLASARYVGGTLALFSKAVSEFDEGVDGLNRRWDNRPLTDEPDDVRAREAMRETLVREHVVLENHLGEVASEAAGKLKRGPNSEDIADLSSRAATTPKSSSTRRPETSSPTTRPPKRSSTRSGSTSTATVSTTLWRQVTEASTLGSSPRTPCVTTSGGTTVSRTLSCPAVARTS